MLSVDGSRRPVAPGLVRALALCDGRRTLAEVARTAGVAKADLIRAQDDGLILIWRSPVPAEAPRQAHHSLHSIIVAPHPDDAALSCGGRMLGDHSVLVLNVFSRSTWWRFPHGPQDADRVQACRRAEEDLVSRLSGAFVRPLDLPEAVLRGHAFADVFTAAPGDRDAAVTAAIAAAVTALAREHPLAHWFLPLGVGEHIDHRIVRDAACAALRRLECKPTHLHFYEDLPYAAKLGPAADFADRLPGCTVRDELLDVEELIDWKLELLRAYWSQFRWSEIAELGRYAMAVGGEVTWCPAAAQSAR
jgi:LmbE family N-acetylglucosaminyl deacetylase